MNLEQKVKFLRQYVINSMAETDVSFTRYYIVFASGEILRVTGDLPGHDVFFVICRNRNIEIKLL